MLAGIAAFNAALALIETLAPVVKQAFNSGVITKEQQQEQLAKIDALRRHDYFTGPAWEVAP
jgi:hypothetical protein